MEETTNLVIKAILQYKIKKNYGSIIYRTDEMGQISITVNKNGKIKTKKTNKLKAYRKTCN